MNRREVLAGSLLSMLVRPSGFASAAVPCPPTSLSLDKGDVAYATTSCFSGVPPLWYQNMPDATWSSIASVGTIDSVKPALHPGGVYESNGPIIAWGGAAFDTKRSALMIGSQGGHGDYYGNEMYSLLINQSQPVWQRITAPRYAFNSTEPYMDDMSPRAVHSGSQIVYAENVDKYVLAMMPFMAPNGNSSRKLFAFDCNTKTWGEMQSPPSGDSGYATGSQDAYGGSCYDPVTRSIWMVQSSSWRSTCRFDPSTGLYTVFDIFNNQGFDGVAALSPSKRIMIYLNGHVHGHDGSFVWLDLNKPEAGWQTAASISGSPLSGRGSSLVWHEGSSAFVGWRGSGAGLVKLVPPSNLYSGDWRWVDISPGSSNKISPTKANNTGTYGRFALATNISNSGRDCLILINASTEPTFVFKLPVGGL